MKVKFVGGPYKGRVEEVKMEGWSDRIRISGVLKPERAMGGDPYNFNLRFRQGEYVKSHVRTGDKVHFVWLGWIPDGI